MYSASCRQVCSGPGREAEEVHWSPELSASSRQIQLSRKSKSWYGWDPQEWFLFSFCFVLDPFGGWHGISTCQINQPTSPGSQYHAEEEAGLISRSLEQKKLEPLESFT